MSENFEKMTVAKLTEIAKERNITISAGMKKAEIISLLVAAESAKDEEKPKKTAEKVEKKPVKSAEKPEKKAKPAGRAKAETLTENKENKADKGSKQIKDGKTSKDSEQESVEKPRATEKANEEPEQTVKKQEARNNRHRSAQAAKQELQPANPAAAKNTSQQPSATQPEQKAEQKQEIKAEQRPEQKQEAKAEQKSEQKPDQNPANVKEGILEILAEGYGFIRCDNFLPGNEDVYVSPTQIRRMNLKTGDIINGLVKDKAQTEKFNALLYVNTVNGLGVGEAIHRKRFEDLTPIFPYERINLETPGCGPAMRMVDIVSPIGKGQRGMIVAQPKAGKTTLLKQIANAIKVNHPEMHIIILLIDERPEEVTDMKESIEGENAEVIYSTFDELPENHKRVSEMVIERAKRLVEHKKDVVILLDSITRLARAYNLTCVSSGRTLSGGLDPAALHMPKRFFGAARKMREGGSLTILATALVETGSRMDDVVFEEFKGTGNMELVLDRNLSERRIFPAIDLPKSSTRRDDLLLTGPEMEANFLMRKALNSVKSDDAVERIIQIFTQTKTNKDFVDYVRKFGILRAPAPTNPGL